MIIGILSDTHGDAERTAAAVRLLRAHGAETLLHCGDIGSESVLTEMAAAGVPAHAVLGNADVYDDDFTQFPKSTGVIVHRRFAELEMDSRRIAIVHGDDERRFREAVASGRFDIVCAGHTHERRDEMVGRTRVINPGAVYRARPPTVAVLDLAGGKLDFLKIGS